MIHSKVARTPIRTDRGEPRRSPRSKRCEVRNSRCRRDPPFDRRQWGEMKPNDRGGGVNDAARTLVSRRWAGGREELSTRMMPRVRQPELMDDPDLDPAAHRRALQGLARINAWSRAGAAIWPAVRALLDGRRDVGERPVRILDVATGAGDIPLDLHRRASRAGIPLEFILHDIAPLALQSAQSRLSAVGVSSLPSPGDAREKIDLPEGAIDIAISSLFLHHLEADEVVRVLKEMARVARLGIVVADLRRSSAGLAAAVVVPRLLTRSPIVHVDAVRSVRAAWTMCEIADFASSAGLDRVSVEPIWPWRWRLVWRRPGVGAA